MAAPLRMLLGIDAPRYERVRGTGTLSPGSVTAITDDLLYNAWPSLVMLPNGDLLTVYVKGNGHNADNSGVIVGKIRSGGTWGTEFTIVDDPTYGLANPALLTSATGRVVLAYNLFDYPNTPADAVRVVHSDDAHLGSAATWSAPYTVNSSFTGECVSGTANMAQLPDGTILLPVYGKNTGATFYSATVFFSADDGETFGSETTMANGPADGRNYFEPTVVLLEDGSLLGLYRTSAGAGTHYKNASTDDGGTWSATSSAFAGFGAPRAIQSSIGTIVAVTRRSADSDLTAFTSINGGTSWVETVLVTPMFESEYGAIVELSPGSYLVVFGDQPSVAGGNADIDQLAVTETFA